MENSSTHTANAIAIKPNKLQSYLNKHIGGVPCNTRGHCSSKPTTSTSKENLNEHNQSVFTSMAEFRLSFTTHYENPSLARAYDQGRELAHKVTLRRFDN
jgi:hypothetical protein